MRVCVCVCVAACICVCVCMCAYLCLCVYAWHFKYIVCVIHSGIMRVGVNAIMGPSGSGKSRWALYCVIVCI